MIKTLKLTNFKCFNNNEIAFQPLTILVGGNASGKSTVVQAILLVKQSIENCRSTSGRFDVRINGPYMMQLGKASNIISNNPTSDEIMIKIINHQDEYLAFEFEYDGTYASHLLKGHLASTKSIISSALADIEGYTTNFMDNISYLHAERLGPRKYLEMGISTELTVGYQGEYVSYVMFLADTRKYEVHNKMKREKRSGRFSHQVEAWMNYILPDLQIDYKTIEDLNMIALGYKNDSLDTNFSPPPNTGFGISYVLPIIVEGLLLSTRNSSIFIIENPEAHLHPRGQSRIGRFLALLSQCGIQVIIETHSEHVVNGARIQMITDKDTPNLQINFFNHSENKIKITPLQANKSGELSAWPPGFFDQEQLDLKEIFFLRKEMRDK